MDRETLEKIVQLREFLIEQHKKLDGSNSPGAAIVKQSTVAMVYESTIRSIDDIIGPHVKFK